MKNIWFDSEESVDAMLINSETLEVGDDGWLIGFGNTNPIDIDVIEITIES